ncbi:MAG: hypothetical protein J6P34_05185 [Paludibacteraceae bacterium]|nr:hypothetical protein [Paludibacteraceae bacterium]
MKKLIFIMALCGAMLFCSCKSGNGSAAESGVNFTVAKNYFFKNGAEFLKIQRLALLKNSRTCLEWRL